MKRREFLLGGVSALGGAITPASAKTDRKTSMKSVERFIRDKAERDHIPGVAACLVNGTDITWSYSYGFANLEQRTPMSIDSVQNIASISKTVTATAAMQAWEAGLFNLDTDINEYLGYSIRNPHFPDIPITARQLLLHTSSLADGPSYTSHYGCGDAKMDLSVWIREYLSLNGNFFDAEKNFHTWAPGEKWAYANIPFGLLGYLVEIVSGLEFHQFCRRNIFAPLGMNDTAWLLSDVNHTRQTTPYIWAHENTVRTPDHGGRPIGVVQQDGPTFENALSDGYHPNCLYSHPNYPDGFLRSSVRDLSRYLRAYLGGGAFNGYRLLQKETVDEMLNVKLVTDRKQDGLIDRQQGVTWNVIYTINGELAWGHPGLDPGVNTDLKILRQKNLGAIVFTNTNHISPWQITKKILETAATI